MKMHLVRQLFSEGKISVCIRVLSLSLRYTTRSTVVIHANKNQNELMVEIYSKSLVRAIGKMLCMKFSQNTN